MSTQLLSRDPITEHRPTAVFAHAPSNAITAVILRAMGIVLLMSIAVIHIVQLVPTFQQAPLLGVAFVLLIAAAVIVGARLIKGHPSAVQLWLPVVALGAAVSVGYAFTRTLSTPLDHQDVGNWACSLGLAALFVEGMLMAVAAYAISLRRSASLEPLGSSNRTSQEP
jgi:hypothetical protein